MRRGVSFEAEGKAYVLRFDINALCDLEARFGCTVAEIGARLGDKPKLVDMRAAFCAGLRNSGVTDEEAGDIMSALGMAEAGRLLGEAMTLAFADPGAKAAPGKRKAAA